MLAVFELGSFRDVVIRLTQLLDTAGVQGALIGGLAAAAYADGRKTNDVDLVVGLPDEDIERFLDLAADLGFDRRLPDAAEFARQARVLLLQDRQTGTPVDIGLAGLAFELEAIESAGPLGPGLGRVIRPEDLIVMKAVAGRPKDILDIEAVLRARPSVDLPRIRALLREFASVLEDDNCVRVLAEAVRTSQRYLSPHRRDEG